MLIKLFRRNSVFKRLIIPIVPTHTEPKAINSCPTKLDTDIMSSLGLLTAGYPSRPPSGTSEPPSWTGNRAPAEASYPSEEASFPSASAGHTFPLLPDG
jgi:hypothetical protein